MNEELKDPIHLSSGEDLKKPLRRRDPRKGRLLLLALGGIVVLAALVIGVTKLAQSIQEYVDLNVDHTIHLTDTTVDKVQRIEIQGRTAVTITRRDGIYTVRELAEAVTSQSACEAAFSNAATLLAEGIAAQDVTDFAPYGLEDPLSTVTITYSDGTTLLLEIGDVAPASQHYYVRVDGGDTVYLMRPLIVEMYSEGVAAYRDLTGFAVQTTGLSSFRVETGAEIFEMQHHARTGGSVFTQWQIVEPELANTDTALTEELVGGLAGIELESFVCNTAEKAEYGLDAPWRTLLLTYEDGSAFQMDLGDTAGLGSYYACFDGTDDVYTVSSSAVSFLDAANLETLVNEFANIVAVSGVESLTVTLDGQEATFTFDRSGEEDVVLRDGTPVDAEAFKAAFQAINVVPVNGFASADDVREAAAALTLTYTFTGEEDPYTVAYLDFSINNYALSKNGSVSVTVSKDDCADMLAQLRALLP
ncbi:MAG: DUF4340 domain-containing protein [Candidatus Spyradocola sp.]|jgi:hypothetical protein